MIPTDHYFIEMNIIRAAIRKAQSTVKQLEWSENQIVSAQARKAWEDLDKIFKRLGGFE